MRQMLTYKIAWVHVSASRLLIAELMLKTKEMNQKALTAFASLPVFTVYENWNIVAVTPEKKVATVARSSKPFAECFCDEDIVGIPAKVG